MSAIILLILRILMSVILYGFVGLIFITLWRDLKNQAEFIRSRQPTPITLSTGENSLLARREYTCAEIILGRDPASDFPVDDQTVSSRHARLSYHQNQWWLEDLASTNGTYLNGDKVTIPVVITQGDILNLGQVAVTIIIGEQD